MRALVAFVRLLAALALASLFLALYAGALAIHDVNRTLLDRAFVRAAAPRLVGSAGDLAAAALVHGLERDHGLTGIDRAAVRALFVESLTAEVVAGFADALYRQFDEIAAGSRERLDVSLVPLKTALRAYRDRVVGTLVRPRLPANPPAAGEPTLAERLDTQLATDRWPDALRCDLPGREARGLAEIRFYWRNRAGVDALLFGLAAVPLLLILVLYLGNPRGGRRLVAAALLAAAALTGLVVLVVRHAAGLAELRAWLAWGGYEKLLDPLAVAAGLFLEPVARAGWATAGLGVGCLLFAALAEPPAEPGPADDGPAGG